MKRIKKSIQIIMALAMLLPMSCQDKEVIESNESGTDKLQFSPTLGEAHTATRAGESDNSVLQAASPAGNTSPHIVIKTYTGTPGSSLKPFFTDELGYFTQGNYWDLNSGDKRFLPSGGMNLYAYFATNAADNAADRGDLTNIKYTPPTEATYPTLTFTVAKNDADQKDVADQVDLIAAKVEGITSPNVLIAFRHILSQINFGVKGMNEHQITVKNIRINEVRGDGTFDYGTWLWTPDANTAAHNYPYYFPNRSKEVQNSGTGAEYQTQGTPDDSQNSYFFGDGGKFGPGEDATFLYAQTDYAQTDPSKSPAYATKENTPPAPLHNSLMLLPQKITKNTKATVTFDYEIKKGDQLVRSGEKSVVSLNAYYDWEPNFRYVYLFKFDDPQKVTFDVIVEPWQNYNGGDGIVGTDELNSANLFNKYVRTLKSGGSYSVPIGPLTKDFVCDWSSYTLDNSFIKEQSFTISFDDVPFKKGKAVIIKPPFGFTASTALLEAKGTVTFTASPYSYYSTSADVQDFIGKGGGNHEFSVSDAVELGKIEFTGSPTDESSLTLHYFTAPNIGTLPPNSRWSVYDKIAVCFPKDYVLTKKTPPYSYTVYTVLGLKAVFDWMDTGGNNPSGSDNSLDYAGRMLTDINLVANARYDLAEVYKSASNTSNPPFVPIGKSESTSYAGIFDGKGATISNLYLNANWTGTERGFFGNVTGKVQYVNLSNVSIVATGDSFVGGLIGFNRGGTVTGCSVQGSVQGSTTGSGVTGGLFGQNSGFVYACSSTATINGASPGGIAGDNWGQIHGCYVTNGKNIAGVNNNTISTSYYVSTSTIGTDFVGVTRSPSIATLNGKISQLNKGINAQYIAAHFISGDLNNTPPTAAPGTVVGAGGGVLKGTFIQNSHSLSWDQDRWNYEMAVLATLGMEYLVLDQVMEYSDYEGNNQYISWYQATKDVLVNDTDFTLNTNTALERCMNACRAYDIKLFIGTFFDKRYWDNGAAVDPDSPDNSTKWYNCITTANNVMNELTLLYFNGEASTKGNYNDVLAGWYFPYEVDDFNFKSGPAQTILKTGITAAMEYRNKPSNPNTKKLYLFSPFMNGKGPHAITGTMTSDQYATLWGEIMATGFQAGDILSPQDCIGTGKFLISDIHEWMPKLQAAANAKNVEFWINVELFTPTGNASKISDLKEQIKASNGYAAKLISFSYPIHYSPNNDRHGDHNAYKAYYDAQ